MAADLPRCSGAPYIKAMTSTLPRLPVWIIYALLHAFPALAQSGAVDTTQQIILQQQVIQQQNQIQRQQQVIDNALGQQRNEDAARRNQADLDNQAARFQSLQPTPAERASSLVEEAKRRGDAAAPQPLQRLPAGGY